MPKPEPALEMRSADDDSVDGGAGNVGITGSKPQEVGAAKTAGSGTDAETGQVIRMIVEMFDGEILTQK